MKAFSLKETVVDGLVNADSLVIEQQHMPGYPDLLCIVKGMMPVFVWVKPSGVDSTTWHTAKKCVEDNVLAINATVWDIEEESDLDRLVAMIVAVTGAQKKPEPTAESEGFGPADELIKETLTPSKSKLNKWLE